MPSVRYDFYQKDNIFYTCYSHKDAKIHADLLNFKGVKFKVIEKCLLTKETKQIEL